MHTFGKLFFFGAQCPDDLLIAFKDLFLRVLKRRELIPERVQDNAISLFIYMAIPPDRRIETEAARIVLWRLGSDGLVYAASALRDILQGAGDKSLTLWSETVGPWFERAWPRRPRDRSPRVSKHLAWMALEAGEAFPIIIDEIRDVIEEDEWDFILNELEKKEKEHNLVRKYPWAAFLLMEKVVGERSDRDLVRKLLQIISNAEPGIMENERFRSLCGRFE